MGTLTPKSLTIRRVLIFLPFVGEEGLCAAPLNVVFVQGTVGQNMPIFKMNLAGLSTWFEVGFFVPGEAVGQFIDRDPPTRLPNQPSDRNDQNMSQTRVEGKRSHQEISQNGNEGFS